MSRWVIIGCLFPLLIGCASRWQHDSKLPSEFYADDRACQVETGGVAAGLEPGTERVSYESCMWEKGWHKKKTIWFFDPAVQ
ncbi:MAG: hypothetical protein AB1Z50_04970 [Desulfuromonadales bacterium]